MNADLLRTFLHVIQAGSFRAAAERLYLTPSAISARIRMLEEELGVELFVRNKQGVSLTAAGRRLQPYAETMLETWNRTCRDIMLPDDAEALIAVGATDSIWHMMLSDWLLLMREKYPRVGISSESGTVETLLASLVAGRLELAVVFDDARQFGLMQTELAQVPFMLFATDAGMRAADAVAGDYVYVDWGAAFADLHSRYFGAHAAGYLRTSVGWLALQLLQRGAATAAYLPEKLAQPLLASGSLHVVSDAPVITRPVNALMQRDGPRWSGMDEAMAVMRRMMA